MPNVFWMRVQSIVYFMWGYFGFGNEWAKAHTRTTHELGCWSLLGSRFIYVNKIRFAIFVKIRWYGSCVMCVRITVEGVANEAEHIARAASNATFNEHQICAFTINANVWRDSFSIRRHTYNFPFTSSLHLPTVIPKAARALFKPAPQDLYQNML